MSNVTIIPGVEKEKYCVGIYARVSSTKIEQLRSMSNQVNGLIQMINNNPKWVLTDVFMDYKSGMTTKREEFNRMLDMCKAKQLDIIITKSVSRFGRNTIDVLTTLQTLVDLGIRIYFEAEQMWSDDPSTRVYITVATAVAEGQVKERHENITWAIREQIRNGTSPLYTKPCYGYKKDDTGELVINHQEANVVKMIFDKYLEGYSIIGIIDYLYNLKIPSPTGLPQWSKRTIEKMLKNEKYAGNVILLKTINEINNKGFIENIPNLYNPKYQVVNNHPAIISAEQFEQVIHEIKRRSNISYDEYGKAHRKESKYSSKTKDH